MTTLDILKSAAAAKSDLARLDAEQKTRALMAIADAIEKHCADILRENAADVDAAKGSISDVMIDRLMLNEPRIRDMADGIRAVAKLPDPAGKILDTITRPNGIVIEKTVVPIGVVAIIYESRPNVTSDAASLALKSGNVCVLRSGKEAFRSANAIVEAMRSGLESVGLKKEFISLIQNTSRESSTELMNAVGYVDLLIPRGGAGLINACVANAKVPYIQTGTGICHIYVDSSAQLDKALNIIENAKTSRPSVCNAEEVLLVAESAAEKFLPMLKNRLVDQRRTAELPPVELRLDRAAAAIIDGTPVTERDFDTEFLDYILAVKIVKDVYEAVDHISRHSTHHSDGIITQSDEAAKYFTDSVDSAAVYVNVSTRFTDGGEFGLGCEMGISTQKLHARGPMGIMELTTYKYVVHGDGQIR